MRLIRAKGSGGEVLRGVLGQNATYWSNSQSALRARSGPSGGVPRGVAWGSPRGEIRGDPPGGVPRGSPEVLGRFWVDSGSILRRFVIWGQIIIRPPEDSDPPKNQIFDACSPPTLQN